MRKLRLLLTEDCNRACPGCCNIGFDLKGLPICEDLTCWDEVYLTGGEPMLNPDSVIVIADSIPMPTKVILYTAKVDPLEAAMAVLEALDGMTLTLHDQGDVEPFLALNEAILETGWITLSLRLNVFEGVQLPAGVKLDLWTVRAGRTWVKDCPIPEGEVFMRLGCCIFTHT